MAFFLTRTFFPSFWSCHAPDVDQLAQRDLVSMLDRAGKVHAGEQAKDKGLHAAGK